MVSTKVRINGITFFYYFVLFLSAYNDILRIPGTTFSFFRLLQPFALLLCVISSKRSRKLTLVFLSIVIVNYIQYTIFTSTNRIGLNFDLASFLTFAYYYLCITTVICITLTIYENNPADFEGYFLQFISIIGKIHLFILFLHGFLRANSSFVLGNINNYGVVVVCICPIYILRAYKQRKIVDIITCILCLVALYVGDCKLSISGMVIEIILVVLFCMKQDEQKLHTHRNPLYLFIGASIILIVIYLSVNNMMGETIYNSLSTTIYNIQGHSYQSESTSIAYRTNVVILGIEWLWKTKFLGIGMGNFGRLVRLRIPYYFSKWSNMDYISPHNGVLEILIEFGPIAIIFYYKIISRVIGAFKKERTDKNILFLVVFISMWLWILNPSEILTIFMLWIVLSYHFIINDVSTDSCCRKENGI